MLSPQEISESIRSRMWTEPKPSSLREACGDAIRRMHPGMGVAEVDGLSEDVEDSVRQYLNEYLDKCATRGVVPSFQWGQFDPRRIVGFRTYRGNLPNEIQERVELAPAVHTTLCQDLSPADFEGLCTRLLARLGCTKYFTTPYSHDGGVDFVGFCPFERAVPRHPVVTRGRVFRDGGFVILGQAKRVGASVRIGVDMIREFYGSALIASRLSESPKGATRTEELLREIGHRPGQAMVLVLATTGTFAKDAETLCDRLGVLMIDGEQLSQTLAIEGIAVKFETGSLQFDPNLLRQWSHGVDPVQ